MNIAVKVDVASFELAKSGTIWGDIWIELEGKAFPETHWNDLAVAFLAELLDALKRVKLAVGLVRVRFFDGQFWLQCEHMSDGLFRIQLNSGVSTVMQRVEFERFMEQLLVVSQAVVDACAVRGWSDWCDVRRLEGLIKSTIND